MKRVKIAKCAPVASEKVESVVIEIVKSIPEFEDLSDAKSWYYIQAADIVDALTETLPQGTLHQVIAQLLERYPVLYAGKAGTNAS